MKNTIEAIKEHLKENYPYGVAMYELEVDSSPTISSVGGIMEIIDYINDDGVSSTVHDVTNDIELSERDVPYEDLSDDTLEQICNVLGLDFSVRKELLISKVIEQIKIDINKGDVTAIDELLRFLPSVYLEGYLSED